MPKPDWIRQVLREQFVQVVHIGSNHSARRHRLPAPFCGAALKSEQRQEPIPPDLVGRAARRDHGATDGGKKPIDHEDSIEREAAFRQFGGVAHIHEHDHDIALTSELRLITRVGIRHRALRRHQRNEGNIERWTELTGKPHAGSSPHTFERRLFGVARRGKLVVPAKNADTAGRAAAASATHVGVRNVVAQARFKHAEAARHAYRSIRVGQRYEAPAMLAQSAQRAGDQSQTKRHREYDEKPGAIAHQRCVLFRCRRDPA